MSSAATAINTDMDTDEATTVTEDGVTRVYKFGARMPDDESKALLIEQMWLAHQYQNRCIEEINVKRQAVRDAAGDPPHASLEDGCPEMDGKLCDACKEHWRKARAEARKIGFYDFKPLRAEFSAKGLRHGAYSAAEDAVKAAEKNAGKKPGWKYGDPLALLGSKSWSKDSHLARAQIFTKTKRLWLRIEDQDKVCKHQPGQLPTKRGVKYRMLWLRVGSTESRKPIWAKIRFKTHREIQGEVRWAAVHMRFEPEQRRTRWWITFTCVNVPMRKDSAKSGTVAVDVGWRIMDDGSIRLAYARDKKGRTTELRLSERWVKRVIKTDKLHGHRKEKFNVIQAAHPELAIYRSARGVARWAHDQETVPEDVAAYLERDRHLWQYERGNGSRIVLHRRDALRNFIRDLRRRYSTVVIKNTSHKELKEEGDGLYGLAKELGHHAAPGETVESAVKAFSEGGAVFKVEAEYTSCTCPSCHHVGEPFAGLMFRCERCDAELDRDEVSTRNMLFDLERGEVVDGTARKHAARFAKRHKKSEQGNNASVVAS